MDPRAGALLQGIQSGTLPGQDLTSNLNTALDLLSPSAQRDMQYQMGGPQALESILGLAPEDVEQLIRQQTGLAVSPSQQLTSQSSMLQMLPDLMNARTNQDEVGVKRDELGIKQQEADTSARKTKVLEDEEARLQAAFEKGTPDEKRTLFDLTLRTIALTGLGPDGKPVDKVLQRNAYRLLTIGEQNPQLTALMQGLLEEGDFDSAGQLLGMDPGTLKNSFRFMGLGRRSPKISEGNSLGPVQKRMETPAATQQQDAQNAVEEQVNTYMQGLLEILESYTGNNLQ